MQQKKWCLELWLEMKSVCVLSMPWTVWSLYWGEKWTWCIHVGSSGFRLAFCLQYIWVWLYLIIAMLRSCWSVHMRTCVECVLRGSGLLCVHLTIITFCDGIASFSGGPVCPLLSIIYMFWIPHEETLSCLKSASVHNKSLCTIPHEVTFSCLRFISAFLASHFSEYLMKYSKLPQSLPSSQCLE